MSTIQYSRSYHNIDTQRLRVDGDVFMSRLKTGSAISVHVDPSTGQLVRSSCSERYKMNFTEVPDDMGWALLQIQPMMYAYRPPAEADPGATASEDASSPIRVGFVAEHLDRHPDLRRLVVRDAEDQPEGIDFQGLVATQHVLLRLLAAEVRALKERVHKLEQGVVQP